MLQQNPPRTIDDALSELAKIAKVAEVNVFVSLAQERLKDIGRRDDEIALRKLIKEDAARLRRKIANLLDRAVDSAYLRKWIHDLSELSENMASRARRIEEDERGMGFLFDPTFSRNGRPPGVSGHPHVYRLIVVLEFAALGAGGDFSPRTLIDGMEVLRDHLPDGMLPQVHPISTYSRVLKRARKSVLAFLDIVGTYEQHVEDYVADLCREMIAKDRKVNVFVLAEAVDAFCQIRGTPTFDPEPD
jgi:hypothetical protein